MSIPLGYIGDFLKSSGIYGRIRGFYYKLKIGGIRAAKGHEEKRIKNFWILIPKRVKKRT